MMSERTFNAPLLIFDLDGTLYRTESSFLRTMRQVYADYAVPHPGDGAVLSMVGETFATFVDWLLGQGFRASRAALQEEIGRAELQAIRDYGELYDGVPDTLHELARRGCALTLCTNGDRRYVDAVLARGGIGGVFDRLSTLEVGGATKSERVSELVRDFATRLPIVVGDRIHDIVAARANGCRMVGALYGYARDGELDSADARIASFPELLDVVARLT
jgi:phosphoglycolate phosphatase